MSRIIKRLRGNAMIEFALVLPVLLILVAGIIDFSFLFYDKAIITNASREAARYGVVLLTPSYASSAQVISYAQTYCSNYLVSFNGTAAVTVTATPSTTPPVFGSTLTVTVSYVYTDLLLHSFISHSQLYQLTATTVMTYE